MNNLLSTVMIPSDLIFKQQIDPILNTASASKTLQSVGSEAHETQVRVEESHEIIVFNFLRPTVDILYSASALSQAVQNADKPLPTWPRWQILRWR